MGKPSLWRLLQWLIDLMVRNVPLLSNWNLPWSNLHPLLLIFSRNQVCEEVIRCLSQNFFLLKSLLWFLDQFLLLWGFAISPFNNMESQNKEDRRLYIKGSGFKMPFYSIFPIVILASTKSEMSLCMFFYQWLISQKDILQEDFNPLYMDHHISSC